MVLKLYGSSTTCTRRVATVLHEKKVPFQLVEVNIMKGDHRTPENLARQPFAMIPYIDDDGFILYESRAICRYICAKYPNQGTALVPTDIKANALFDQAASIETSNFDAYAASAINEAVFKPMKGIASDKAVFDKLIETLAAKLDVYDRILANQKYLAGDEVTLADLFHLPYGAMLAVAGSDIMESKPNLARWWKDITARPSWQAVKEGPVKSTA